MLIYKNHLSLRQTRMISPSVVFCHSKVTMKSYIPWLSIRIVKINYEIHDKELLAIVDSFAQWRHCLEGCPHQVIVFNDHKNLAYFQNAHVLNR